jgi:hypothetical protein
LALMGCGASRDANSALPVAHATTVGTSSTTVPGAARAAVIRWLGHVATHDDAAAFADLAPRSQAAVGDLANYERGSGRFGTVYAQFAGPDAQAIEVLGVTDNLVVVTVRSPGVGAGALVAVPVRHVSEKWLVDPILDVGTYAFRPDSGATVGPQPILMTQLDDPATRARVWFDDSEGAAVTSASSQPQRPLSPGWHVVTIVMLRGDDVVARIVTLHVG